MLKVPVPHLKNSCTFLYILVHFQISFASKVLVPHLNFVAEIGMLSVHFCTFLLVRFGESLKPAKMPESEPCSGEGVVPP